MLVKNPGKRSAANCLQLAAILLTGNIQYFEKIKKQTDVSFVMRPARNENTKAAKKSKVESLLALTFDF